jgi:hypothetical protein
MIKSVCPLLAIKLDLSEIKLFAWNKHIIQHKLFRPSPLIPLLLIGEPFQLCGEFKIKVSVVAAMHSVQSLATNQPLL